MKPAKGGPVLAAMETAKAQELTALLANRLVLPAPQAPAAQPQHAADASAMPTLPGGTPIVGDATASTAAPPAQPGG